MTGLVLTKLDVLDAFPEVKIAIAYRLPDGSTTDIVPDTWAMEKVTPVWETWRGWEEDTSRARSWEDLPPNAQRFLRRLESLAGVPLRYVSVGPEDPFQESCLFLS